MVAWVRWVRDAVNDHAVPTPVPPRHWSGIPSASLSGRSSTPFHRVPPTPGAGNHRSDAQQPGTVHQLFAGVYKKKCCTAGKRDLSTTEPCLRGRTGGGEGGAYRSRDPQRPGTVRPLAARKIPVAAGLAATGRETVTAESTPFSAPFSTIPSPLALPFLMGTSRNVRGPSAGTTMTSPPPWPTGRAAMTRPPAEKSGARYGA
jgi:hypothetical protein